MGATRPKPAVIAPTTTPPTAIATMAPLEANVTGPLLLLLPLLPSPRWLPPPPEKEVEPWLPKRRTLLRPSDKQQTL